MLDGRVQRFVSKPLALAAIAAGQRSGRQLKARGGAQQGIAELPSAMSAAIWACSAVLSTSPSDSSTRPSTVSARAVP